MPVKDDKSMDFESLKDSVYTMKDPTYSCTVDADKYGSNGYISALSGQITNQLGYQGTYPYTNVYGYQSYPIYVDRTQKALSIAKWLMDQKLIKVADVPTFLTLIEGLTKLI